MAIENIINQIGEDARAESDSLLSVARAEADAVRERAAKEAERLRSEALKKAKERAEEHARRIETLAGLELRKEVLQEKKNLIGEAFAKAEERITSLPPEEYLAFLRPIILGAVDSGNEEVILSKRHRSMFTADFLNTLNHELGPQKGRLRLIDESGEFSGGFILRDGKMETNMTLRSLMDSRRDDLEPKVAGILFGEDKNNG